MLVVLGLATAATASALAGHEAARRAPALLQRPTVTATAQVGNLAVATAGRWARASRLRFAWERCGAAGTDCHPISALTRVAHGSSRLGSLRLTERDVGRRLRVQVEAINPRGTRWATSLPTRLIRAANPAEQGSGAPPSNPASSPAGGSPTRGSSGSCSGSELCVGLAASGASFADGVGSQESYPGFVPSLAPPDGGFPNVAQRLAASGFGLWRILSEDGYNDATTSQIEPANFTAANGKSVTAWNFIGVDKELSDAPAGATRELEQNIPDALWTGDGGMQGPPVTGAVADQSFAASAAFYADVVRYFRTGVLASGSGNTAYTSTTLTDPAVNFSGDAGDCVTATVIDSNGFADWVTGTIASVGGASGDTITLTGSWSDAESFDVEAGGGQITNTTPAVGAAFRLASCTPPSGLTSPQDAKPWPLPPSVGNVQYYELGNEYDLSSYNQNRQSPALPPPSGITLTGVNAPGGVLVPGTTYYYELASANAQGGLSLPGSAASITLSAGHNAVQVSWAATSADDLSPSAYVIYGRSSGSEQSLVSVGQDAFGGLAWTDKGTITPSGAPSSSDASVGGTIFTPNVYVKMWNAIAPAMKAVDPTIGITGPTQSNTINIGGTPWVDTTCVTTAPPASGAGCSNGHPGWMNNTSYVPELLSNANVAPAAITFHEYGGVNATESTDFANIIGSEIANYNRIDKPSIDAAHVPVWIDETNLNAADAGAQSVATDFRSMTQLGSAWLADELIDWANTDSQVQQLAEYEAQGANDANFALFGTANKSGNGSCIPQPACQNVTTSEPDLLYWTIRSIDAWLTNGTIVAISNVPAGFNALAVQTSPTTVEVLLVNTQTSSSNGNGAAASLDLQLAGAVVTDTKRITINAATNMSSGPVTQDLGAQSNIPLATAGYEVDLLNFTI